MQFFWSLVVFHENFELPDKYHRREDFAQIFLDQTNPKSINNMGEYVQPLSRLHIF